MRVISIIRPPTSRDNFSDHEHRVFTELIGASNQLMIPLNPMHGQFNCVGDLKRMNCYTLEREIGNVTSFCRRLPYFNHLCQNDQLALIKYGAVEIINMRSVLYFDQHEHYWNIFIVSSS
ncbi:unnamed protein product [Medioppia subpectinata]|uniref:NR LBD domain-containing protein n=1 Tax=Medioppia subpectinata TaxID=1979941 RepID=A0A7R9PY71_9ACAR|nr:unnamed protein product [Medioppia subpectinata]CAG2104769.1 unnamed protein product [Medioppia subpectinata]